MSSARARLTMAGLCVCGLVAPGCGSAGTGLSTFSTIPANVLTLLPTNNVMLEIINNVRASDGTAYTVELDITIDGTPYTLTALPGIATKYAFGSCPGEVRTIVERWYDAKGRVVGGRDYAGVDANSFPAGSFGCGNTLLWQLSTTAVETQVL